MTEESTRDSPQDAPCHILEQRWIREQELLRTRLIEHDSFAWKPNSCDSDAEYLKYIGGADLSFVKDDPLLGCGALVVLKVDTMEIVYEDFEIVQLDMPYIPGFLAFRESPVLLRLLHKLHANKPALYPQLLMIDGNGILHPRGFGLACQIGVLADIPTIGIGKNLHLVDGLDDKKVRKLAREMLVRAGDFVPLIGNSGRVWGAALKSNEECEKPIFVSIGHRISLDTAVFLVGSICKFRVPEPIRQADIRSREFIRKMHSQIPATTKT